MAHHFGALQPLGPSGVYVRYNSKGLVLEIWDLGWSYSRGNQDIPSEDTSQGGICDGSLEGRSAESEICRVALGALSHCHDYPSLPKSSKCLLRRCEFGPPKSLLRRCEFGGSNIDPHKVFGRL